MTAVGGVVGGAAKIPAIAYYGGRVTAVTATLGFPEQAHDHLQT